MVIPKGTKFSAAHRRHMSEARLASPKAKAHHERMREIMKGRHPLHATATHLANKAVRKLGLDPAQVPWMHQAYMSLYLSRLSPVAKETE